MTPISAAIVAGQFRDRHNFDRRQAAAADAVATLVEHQYRAGAVSYVEVFTARTSANAARTALAQTQAQRQTTAVTLIQTLGGRWREPTC